MAVVRTSLAAWPYAALHWPCKRIAVLAGLGCGGFYMVLTGSQVPMVRSFMMAGFVAIAILVGRQAISMRSLAIAAALLILIDPDSLTGASMQMSFAAVMALIAGHEAFGGRLVALHRNHGWPGRIAAYLLGLVLTSLLAGTATLPFGTYHFGRVQFYFALSNLLAVPLTGVLVMPAGMLGLALMPLGLERPALIVMGWGIEGVLWIAHATADLPGATWRAPHMPPWGLVVVALGMMWLALWRSRLRLAGVAALLLGLASPMLVRPPDLLVSAEARLIAVRTPAGVFLQQVSGASKFTREAWLHYWARGRIPSNSDPGHDRRWRDRVQPRGLPAAPCGRRQGGTAGARCGASGRVRRGVRHRIGGAGPRPVPAPVAGAGRSLHGVALRRHRDLAGRPARPHRDRSRLSRRPAVGAATAGTAPSVPRRRCPRRSLTAAATAE